MPLVDELATAVATVMKAQLDPVRDALHAARAESERLAGELAFLSGASVTMRERVDLLEARPAVPGPPGPAGPPGADGKDGAAGTPGPTGLTGKFADSYRDVYDAEKTYAQGDLVTDDGSIWLCKDATTTDRPGTSAAWKLIVKRGMHGRDVRGR